MVLLNTDNLVSSFPVRTGEETVNISLSHYWVSDTRLQLLHPLQWFRKVKDWQTESMVLEDRRVVSFRDGVVRE